MTKSEFAFRRSSPKTRALPDLISSRCLLPVSISMKQPPLPHPPEPSDPPDPPDLPQPLKKRLGLYLGSAPLVYYCAIDPSSPPLGLVSPDRRVSPASLEVCPLSTTTTTCYYVVEAHSPLSLGLISPMEPTSLVIVTLSRNLVPLDIRCPPLSVMELSLLPSTTLVYSGPMGSNLLKCILLVTEVKMAAFSRLVFDDSDSFVSVVSGSLKSIHPL